MMDEEVDVEALGYRVAAFLKGLDGASDFETDAYDTVFECYVTIDGKRFSVSVEPDERAGTKGEKALENETRK